MYRENGLLNPVTSSEILLKIANFEGPLWEKKNCFGHAVFFVRSNFLSRLTYLNIEKV